MDENNELLTHINKDANMAVLSLTNLMKEIKTKENKIKTLVETEIKCYEEFVKKSKKLLKKEDLKEPEESLMAKMGVTLGVKKEVLMDNSDASLAHMITEGLTMGIVNMETKIKSYKDKVDKKTLSLAKDFLKFQECEVEKLKKYM